MNAATAAWTKLDLARHGLLRLSFGLRITGPRLREVFENVAPLEDTESFYVAGLKYSRSKVEHVVVENAWVADDDADAFEIDVEYRTGDYVPEGAVPREFRTVGLTRKLASQGQTIDQLGAVAEYFFPEEVAGVTLLAFPLPMPIGAQSTASRNPPFDEIQGIRGVKFEVADPQVPRYRFLLDRPDNGAIRLTIWLDESFISGKPDIPTVLLHRMNAIAGRLIRTRTEANHD